MNDLNTSIPLNSCLKIFTENKFPEYDRSGKGQLSGLNFAVKDNVAVAGEELTFGLNPPFTEKSEKNAEIVNLLLKKGAFLKARTNMDPGAMSISGENPYYGNMKNKINPALPLGGSSGGAALMVATKNADFAVVSDHGGSARIPAALCGITGIKFTPGLFSTEGCALLDWYYDCLGMIAESATTLHSILTRIGIKNESAGMPAILIPSAEGLADCRPEIKAGFYSFIEKISGNIDIVEIREDPNLLEINKVRKIIISKLFKDLLQHYDPRLLPRDLQMILKYADNINDEAFNDANKKTLEIGESLKRYISNNSFYLSPLFPIAAASVNDFSGAVNSYLNIANIAGLPAINLKSEGLFQLIGPVNSELSLCLICRELEKH